jgi:hypothetical protein
MITSVEEQNVGIGSSRDRPSFPVLAVDQNPSSALLLQDEIAGIRNSEMVF